MDVQIAVVMTMVMVLVVVVVVVAIAVVVDVEPVVFVVFVVVIHLIVLPDGQQYVLKIQLQQRVVPVGDPNRLRRDRVVVVVVVVVVVGIVAHDVLKTVHVTKRVCCCDYD